MSDIICRWRDAITDPPPDGYYLLSGNTRDSLYCVYMSGQWIEDGSSMLVDIQPCDQWLDVTDVPAVAVAKVQAAVDEIARIRRRTVYGHEGVGLDIAIDELRNHAGITPSVVKDSLITETEVTP